MEWQPIGTAPKDGRRVLVWMDEESLKRDQRQVQFAKLWFYEDGTLGGGAEGFNGKWNITHWMDVPEAPNAEVRGRAALSRSSLSTDGLAGKRTEEL